MSETPNRSRRRFLSALPTITVGLITEPVQASPAKSSRWAMLVDTRRCIACQRNTQAIALAAMATTLGACLLLLYTGMETMVVSARILWNTPVLPLLFLSTAFVGGIGMTLLVAALNGRNDVAPQLNRWLAYSLTATFALLFLWGGIALSGASAHTAEALAALSGSSLWSTTGLWFLTTSLICLWLAIKRPGSLWPAALLALHTAWVLRWIVFIGGQGIPKMGSTWFSYSLSIGTEGVLGIVGSLGLALFLYIVLTGLLPWDERAEA